MRTECSAAQFAFGGVGRRRVVAGFDGGAVSSEAGALLLRHTGRAIGLREGVAACGADQRERDRVEDSVGTGRAADRRHRARLRGRQRHDERRHDPVLARFADRAEAVGVRGARRQQHAQSAGTRPAAPG